MNAGESDGRGQFAGKSEEAAESESVSGSAKLAGYRALRPAQPRITRSQLLFWRTHPPCYWNAYHTCFLGVIVVFVVVVRKMERELITILYSNTQSQRRIIQYAVNEKI